MGSGTVPTLGPVLDPGLGAWTSAAGGRPVSSEQLRVPGLTGAVTVSYSAQGLASISAGSTHDAFLAEGYVEAKFRLAELDAERRLGEGQYPAPGPYVKAPLTPVSPAAASSVPGTATTTALAGDPASSARLAGCLVGSVPRRRDRAGHRGLAGLPPYAGVTLAVAALLAALQVLVGMWLGRAVFPARR